MCLEGLERRGDSLPRLRSSGQAAGTRVEAGRPVGTYCGNPGESRWCGPGHWLWRRRQELGIWIQVEDGGDMRWNPFPRVERGLPSRAP